MAPRTIGSPTLEVASQWRVLSSHCRALQTFRYPCRAYARYWSTGRYLFRLLRLAVSVNRTAKSKNSAQLSETYACPEVRTEGLGAPIRSPLLMVGLFASPQSYTNRSDDQLAVARIMTCLLCTRSATDKGEFEASVVPPLSEFSLLIHKHP